MSTVVVLLSDKRSGSTMFQEELCRHPQVATVEYSPHQYLETHWWLMSAVLLRRPASLFMSNKVYEGYGSRKNARALMVAILEKNVPGFVQPNNDRALVFEGWEALCRTFARPVFLEKSPQVLAHWSALSLILEWMKLTSFEVKFVGLVRNPHGVLYSASKLFGTDPATRQFAWLNSQRNLLAIEALLPAQRYMRVLYEDLVAHPNDRFRQIASFAGVGPSVLVGAGVHGSSTEKWKNDGEYRLLLDPAVRQVAMTMGYSDLDLNNPNATTTSGSSAAPAPSVKRRARIWLNRRRDRAFQPAQLRLRALMKRAP